MPFVNGDWYNTDTDKWSAATIHRIEKEVPLMFSSNKPTLDKIKKYSELMISQGYIHCYERAREHWKRGPV